MDYSEQMPILILRSGHPWYWPEWIQRCVPLLDVSHLDEMGTAGGDRRECTEQGSSMQGKCQRRKGQGEIWEGCTKASELELKTREHLPEDRSTVCAAGGYNHLPRAVKEELWARAWWPLIKG